MPKTFWQLFIAVVIHHSKDIGRGGLPTFSRKVRGLLEMTPRLPKLLFNLPAALLNLLMMVPASLILLVAFTLKPAVLIRFGQLPSNRIGHLSTVPELYLCGQDLTPRTGRTVDIFFYDSSVSNQQLKKMWDRTLKLSSFARWPHWLARNFPGFGRHVILLPRDGLDIYCMQRRTNMHLAFTPEEELLGSEELRGMGIPEGAPFVCLHGRDSAYLDAMGLQWNSGSEFWRYHDFQDSSINDYLTAADELTRRGFFVIRMGAVVNEALNTCNPMIIDYATKHRTDFLDIYLSAKCHLFLGCSSGLSGVPMLFRRPISLVNVCPLGHSELSAQLDQIFIPKKLWLISENRFITFREILNSELRLLKTTNGYEDRGIKVVDNTPEEITAVAVEMDERVKGTWQAYPEDEELQIRFVSLFNISDPKQIYGTRIGADFLRKNVHLLD